MRTLPLTFKKIVYYLFYILIANSVYVSIFYLSIFIIMILTIIQSYMTISVKIKCYYYFLNFRLVVYNVLNSHYKHTALLILIFCML